MRSAKALVLLLLQLSAVVITVTGQDITCDWIDPATKIHYDLSPLKSPGLDYSFVPPSTGQPITYYINVCTPVVKTTCGNGVAACQTWNGGDASLGQATTLQLGPITGFTGQGLTGSFVGGDEGRSFEIDFKCDKTKGKGMPEYLTQTGTPVHYVLQWFTEFACEPAKAPGGGGDGGSSDDGLSGGSIFLIILLVSVVVYFVGGIVVNKFVRKTEGVADTIPNAGFWSSIPGLVRDGFKYVIGKARGTSGGGNGAYQQTA